MSSHPSPLANDSSLSRLRYSNGIAGYYDLFAPKWGEVDSQARFILDLVAASATVLDIGAGIGDTSAALAGSGLHVTALEPDPEMYQVMLARLSISPAVQSNMTPICRPAGYPFTKPFDVCLCFSVLHLLTRAQREDLVAYARKTTRPGGHLVITLPVVSSERRPRPWHLAAQRQFGEMCFDHRAAIEQQPDGSWETHWSFRAMHGSAVIDEVHQTFRWSTLGVEESTELLRARNIEIEAEYADFEGTPFEPGVSRVRTVVGRAA